MKEKTPCVLAFESSCDENAIAVVSETGQVLFQNLSSQIEVHKIYGGVVPEVASRLHSDAMGGLLEEALQFIDSQKDLLSIEKVAATKGPGLMGSLLVGASCAEGVAFAMGKKLEGIHHLRGHLASVLLADSDGGKTLAERSQSIFPAWVVLVSGGHTQILYCDDRLNAEILASTADDAAGECFDKSAKLMGMPYPGGPMIERRALEIGDDKSMLEKAKALSKSLPRPRSQTGFSFSGLKTAIRLKLEANSELKSDPAFAWAVQDAICESLLGGLKRTITEHKSLLTSKKLVFCGGVSANQYLRGKLDSWAQAQGIELILPPLKYCTDNAAMIGAAAWVQDPELSLSDCKARIPLSPTDFKKGKQTKAPQNV
ncbi:tRNA (adenosine(37)-N6)-threonylcarbamoyltransferase complex transferase subunit TsaD [bacterium]|nr:tRNA (adenosine(37)-N6)-threonylcarbamoyltransferase complex transferase subunit TsaD [bacterium]